MTERSHERNSEVPSEASMKPRNWRDFISYPSSLKEFSIELLDNVASLIPLPDGEDKYFVIGEFLRQAEKHGLINRQEHARLRDDIGPNL